MSERKLSKSYGSLEKWKSTNGRTQQWIRWEFSTPKEEWLGKNKLTERWLYENLEWMTEGGEVSSIRKANESRLYYIVTTQKGEEYYLIFEQTKAVNALILIFEDHWQNYSYNTVLHTLNFDYEVYDCFQNSIESISFRHCNNKETVYVETIIVGGKIDLNFSISHNLPVWRLLSDYRSLFEEISKYNLNSIGAYDKRQQIHTVAEIAKMFRECKSEVITRFRVIFDYNHEWLDVDSNGESMKARLCDDGNYVICHKDGSTEWLGKYPNDDGSYRIKDGVIVNWKNEKVTDQKLAKTIISDIREAKRLFYRVKQEFWAN